MQELRFVAVSEDGSYAVLAVPGRSGRYILPIDERLRAVALGQTSRLAQYEIEVESPLRPKEIQARIRAGETAEEIADAAGIPVERVRWFEGPVLAERAYIADQAQSGSVRRAGDSVGPGPRLGEVVTGRLTAAGTDPADGQWDSRKRGDGNWQVSLTFPSGGRLHVAEWVFDPRRRHVMPDDDNAARLSLPESELPAEPVPVPGEATVTSIAPRLGAAAGIGGGVSAPGVSRFRPDRSVIPDRSLGVDRSLVERPAAMPDRAAAGLPDRAAAPAPPVPPRPGQQDRPSPADRPAHPGYAEFPESAPYRAPEPAPSPAPPADREPHGYEDPASVPEAFRAPAAEPAYGDRRAGSAARHADADESSAFDQPERVPVTPPRHVVFEDPGPTFLDEQFELAPEPAPAQPLAESFAATPEPAVPAPPARGNPLPESRGADAAAEASSPAERVTPTVPVRVPAPAEAPGPRPAAAAGQAAASAAAKTPGGAVTSAGPSAQAEPVATAEPAAPVAGATAPAAETATAASEPAEAEAPESGAEAPFAAGHGEAQQARRPGAKKNAKARRSSVPSWDEIMLGSSRQRD